MQDNTMDIINFSYALTLLVYKYTLLVYKYSSKDKFVGIYFKNYY